MTYKSQVKLVLLVFLSILFFLSSQSQTRKYFIINGKIISDMNNTDFSSVKIVKDKKNSATAQIPGHGRFRLELEYNSEYELTFQKEGFQSKTIVVNTSIPEKALDSTSNFSHFLMAVKLLPGGPDQDNTLIENQVQYICYSNQKDDFARVLSPIEVKYVEKGNYIVNTDIRSQENTKPQTYQVF